MLPAVCFLSAVWPQTPTTQATLYQRPDCWKRFLVLLVKDVIKPPGTYFNNWLQLSCRSSKFSSPFPATSVLLYGVWHLQTADCRLQTADCRLQTADCRPQIADCKSKDTKNLPNKGDTIKNITSCESEKVAKLASFPRCFSLFFTDATLYWLTQHITNCVDSLFFFDYCELIITSNNAH